MGQTVGVNQFCPPRTNCTPEQWALDHGAQCSLLRSGQKPVRTPNWIQFWGLPLHPPLRPPEVLIFGPPVHCPILSLKLRATEPFNELPKILWKVETALQTPASSQPLPGSAPWPERLLTRTAGNPQQGTTNKFGRKKAKLWCFGQEGRWLHGFPSKHHMENNQHPALMIAWEWNNICAWQRKWVYMTVVRKTDVRCGGHMPQLKILNQTIHIESAWCIGKLVIKNTIRN